LTQSLYDLAVVITVVLTVLLLYFLYEGGNVFTCVSLASDGLLAIWHDNSRCEKLIYGFWWKFAQLFGAHSVKWVYCCLTSEKPFLYFPHFSYFIMLFSQPFMLYSRKSILCLLLFVRWQYLFGFVSQFNKNVLSCLCSSSVLAMYELLLGIPVLFCLPIHPICSTCV